MVCLHIEQPSDSGHHNLKSKNSKVLVRNNLFSRYFKFSVCFLKSFVANHTFKVINLVSINVVVKLIRYFRIQPCLQFFT